MSNVYNLNDNVNEYFEFQIGEHKYKMLYPTMEQIEELQAIAKDNEAKKAYGQPTDESAFMNWVYSFISPTTEGSPAIVEVMKHQNIVVMKNFSKMFKTELGLE